MTLSSGTIHGHDRRFQLRIMDEKENSNEWRKVIQIWDTLNDCRGFIPNFDTKESVGDIFILLKQYCNELNDQHEDRLKYEKEISNFTGRTIFIQG